MNQDGIHHTWGGVRARSFVMNLDGIHHKWGGVRAGVICDESGRDSSQMGGFGFRV